MVNFSWRVVVLELIIAKLNQNQNKTSRRCTGSSLRQTSLLMSTRSPLGTATRLAMTKNPKYEVNNITGCTKYEDKVIG